MFAPLQFEHFRVAKRLREDGVTRIEITESHLKSGNRKAEVGKKKMRELDGNYRLDQLAVLARVSRAILFRVAQPTQVRVQGRCTAVTPQAFRNEHASAKGLLRRFPSLGPECDQ